MRNIHFIQKKLEDKGTLIAAHQGTFGGNICTNTISSGKNALLHGADIIEADVTRDSDGVMYMFHDAHEMFNFGSEKHISEMKSEEVKSLRCFNSNGDRRSVCPDRLEDYLAYFSERDCIINLDRCWDIWEDVNRLVAKYDMFDRIIFKSPPLTEYYEYVKRSDYPMIYMPIVSSVAETEEALQYGINPSGFEILYKTEASELVSDEFIQKCHTQGLLLWSNSITLNDVDVLSAGYDDNAYIEQGKDIRKWHFGKGFDIVQTDWPALWCGFRDRYKQEI